MLFLVLDTVQTVCAESMEISNLIFFTTVGDPTTSLNNDSPKSEVEFKPIWIFPFVRLSKLIFFGIAHCERFTSSSK